jgi:peptide deformylase
MSRLPIRLYGDPVLRTKAREIPGVDDELREFAEVMRETMIEADGAGLAANQVGDLRRIIVVNFGESDTTEDVRILLNPEITSREGTARMVEGCLSLPGIEEEVERASRLSIRYLNLAGEIEEVEVSGLHSAIIQHEIDHLDGVLFIDRISPLRRQLLKGALRKISRGSKKSA